MTAAIALPSLACGTASPSRNSPPGRTAKPVGRGRGRTLLAYFSRPGENYYHGGRKNLRVGNTEILAHAIASRVDCDLHEIKAEDPYSSNYDATVERNVEEQEADSRPGIANPIGSIDQYETILLGSPIWNVRPPMIMLTFAEGADFTGKTVLPFVTYAVSGLGTAESDYEMACQGARIEPGLAVRGEAVRGAAGVVDSWLRRGRLLD